MFCKRKIKNWQAQTVILWEYSVWFDLQRAVDTITFTHFCSVATSISAPLPFLYASSVNETTMAWIIMRFIFSYFCVLPFLKFECKLQSVKTKKVLFFKYCCSIQIILSSRLFLVLAVSGRSSTFSSFWPDCPCAVPIMTNHRTRRIPLWIVFY